MSALVARLAELLAPLHTDPCSGVCRYDPAHLAQARELMHSLPRASWLPLLARIPLRGIDLRGLDLRGARLHGLLNGITASQEAVCRWNGQALWYASRVPMADRPRCWAAAIALGAVAGPR